LPTRTSGPSSRARPAAAPNGVGHVANFGAGIAGGSTVTSAGETFDTINFNNAGNVNIDGTGLTVGSKRLGRSDLRLRRHHTINAPLTMGSNLSIKTSPGTSVTLGAAVNGAKTLGVYWHRHRFDWAPAGRSTTQLGLEVRSGTLGSPGQE
jgi:hypothetical protein